MDLQLERSGLGVWSPNGLSILNEMYSHPGIIEDLVAVTGCYFKFGLTEMEENFQSFAIH